MRQETDKLWPAGFDAWIKVGIVYAKTTRHIATLMRPLDLTVAQFDAIAHLYVEDGVTQQQLAQQLLVTKGNVTGLVNRLAERGLVERRTDPDDRRANHLHLTRAGRRLAKRSLSIQAELVERMMGGLSKAEHETLYGLLNHLANHFPEDA